MPLPAKREQQQLKVQERALTRHKTKDGLIIDVQWQEVTLDVIEREARRAPYRPLDWRSVLRSLAGAALAGLMSAVMIPGTWSDLAHSPPRNVIGWSWPLLQLLGVYNFGTALVMAALGAGAVFGVISEFRAWLRQ